MASSNNVQVVVRIRPKQQKEEIDMCKVCTRVSPSEPQIWLGHEKTFTFDSVFDIPSHQEDIYTKCVRPLVDGCFEGFNATVLAYGQTGSGKTYTMGTGFDVSGAEDQKGIIPRAVSHLFNTIQERRDEAKSNGCPLPEFHVTAQFIEIYNEEIIDLLCEDRKKGTIIRIHEDSKRGIQLIGAESKPVSSAEETLAALKAGSLFRTTGATLMNSESSRSHAIFTLFIKQTRYDRIEKINDENQPPVHDADDQQELVTLTAKFNFVDLAGSERLSRTGAVGERAREGISINSGLLHLGNVISALGDRAKKAVHVPYRDSKLTRVLQDSLGGNSVTTMIACISPCDRDFVETLNTLRYANRAKNIKNKIVANQDSQTQLITDLRRQIFELQIEIQELKQGKMLVKSDGEIEMNDVYIEKEMLQRDLNNVNIRLKALNARMQELENENMSLKLNKIASTDDDKTESEDAEGAEDYRVSGQHIRGYLKEINTLRSKIAEDDALIATLRKQISGHNNGAANGASVQAILEKARQKLEFEKSVIAAHLNEDGGESSGDEDEEPNEEANEVYAKSVEIQNSEILALRDIIMEKERMIEEAETRERRIMHLTEHYEEKISTFKDKIRQTEEERDNLLGKFKKENDDSSTKQMKQDYERKLAQLQKEMRKYEALRRDHDKTLQQESTFRERLRQMRQEVIETKQTRVKLLTQLREQMSKHQKEMHKNKLEINKLTRVKHQNEYKIKDLQIQSNKQKMVLQRREEEIKALRRQVKPMGDRVAGKVGGLSKRNTPQKTRSKWSSFEQKFNKILLQRTTCENEEKKLAHYLEERQRAAAEIQELKKREKNEDKDDLLDSLENHYQYLSKCIEDSQAIIAQFEVEDLNIEPFFIGLDSQDMIYVMNKIANTAINYAIVASEKDVQLKEKDHELRKLGNDYHIENQLLNFMVEKDMDHEAKDILPFVINSIALDNAPPLPVRNSDRFRRLTMTPSQLLYFEQSHVPFSEENLPRIKREMAEFRDRTFTVDKEDQLNTTFVVNEKSKTTKTTPGASSSPMPSDRMTQSLHVDNHSHGSVYPGTARVSEPEMVRASSTSSVKELNNVATTTTRSAVLSPCPSLSQQQQQQHYLLSPHLMRRRMPPPHSNNVYQQQQTSPFHHHQPHQLDSISENVYVYSSNNNNNNNHLFAVPLSPGHKGRTNTRALNHNGTAVNNNNYLGMHHGNNVMNNNVLGSSPSMSSGSSSVNNSFTSLHHYTSHHYQHHHNQLQHHNNQTSSPQASPLPSRHAMSHDSNNVKTFTPPGSPSFARRMNAGNAMVSSLTTATQDNDVFSRLTNTSSVASNLAENSLGQIISINSSNKQDKSFPLVVTHSAVGHQRPVLSIAATSEVLFSGSKDCTAKLWDLQQGVEVCSLNDHPDAVNVIRYDEANKLIFTCSKSIIKIWDPRQDPVNCIKTLSSNSMNGINFGSDICDMRLSRDGYKMFCTNEKLVRIFDLRATYAPIAKLQTGHKSLVTCLAVDREAIDSRVVVTGSKDHTIRVFKLEDEIAANNIYLPQSTLEPPHYDGIEALKLIDGGRYLFSSGRDGCIKKWDLVDGRLKSSLATCHRDWVLALDTLSNESLLLSACRGGMLRLMNTSTCQFYGEQQAHNAAINDIATLNDAAFTASNDSSINIWKLRSNDARG